ncbi:hypothetical protein SAICODRAFT_9762 [Saitoella complicata NRRL Y-17804]|nr:uncharacterized protein SAICODRAFT_9762 [Saitoella complicata NRRL Y-17804]ODQ50485.1 hypothetical protein SAICODRAFT_9762 [Saitoella complicata NRRL Y-17804]
MSSKTTPTQPTYISSSGSLTTTKPLHKRIYGVICAILSFVYLYFRSLFSLNPQSTAAGSRSRGGTVGGWSSGRSMNGGSGSGRRIGRVDDVRGPEYGSGGCPPR